MSTYSSRSHQYNDMPSNLQGKESEYASLPGDWAASQATNEYKGLNLGSDDSPELQYVPGPSPPHNLPNNYRKAPDGGSIGGGGNYTKMTRPGTSTGSVPPSCPKKDRKFAYFFYTLIVALIFALVVAIFVLEPEQREALFMFDSEFLFSVHNLFVSVIYASGLLTILFSILYVGS